MKISYEEYKDAQTRFDAYVKEKNTDPENIRIGSSNIKTTDLIALSKINPSEFPVEYGGVIEDKPPVKSQLDLLYDKFGKFTTVCDFYDKVVRKCNYSYYYNQRTTVNDVIQTLVNNGTIALNCTDWSMFTAWICLQLGYNFRIYNRVCSSGAGHVNMSIYSEDGWYTSDPAAISDQSDRRYKCLGDCWCDTNNGSRIVDTSNVNQLLSWMHY